MFQLKNFVSIVASMINHMRGTQNQITDFNVGSVARSMIEAPAVEIDELYQQMFIGLKEAIPVSTYNSFGFGRLPAVTARGRIRVTITSSDEDTLIPAGTVFKTQNAQTDYESLSDVIIAAGDTYADVLVQARTAGAAGNIPVGKSFTLQPTLADLVSATNPAAFRSGADEETDAQRKDRFAKFVQSLQRGTVASIEYGLSTVTITDSDGEVTERVVSAAVVEPYLLDPEEPIALVECYLHNGQAPASSGLVSRASQVIHGYTDTNGEKIPGWKAAGVHVDIYPATEVTVNVTAEIVALPGYDAAALAADATGRIDAYLAGIPMSRDGNSALLAEIIRIIKSIEGVYDVDVSVPTGNVDAGFNEKIMPGTVTIT